MVTLPRIDAVHIINALRQGTVPARGLHHYAVGMDRELQVLLEQLDEVAHGHSHFKAIRGVYGSGKTFAVSRLAEEALQRQFVVSQVVLNRDAYSLHLLERLYQGIMQNLRIRGTEGNALLTLLDRWLDSVESYVVEVQGVPDTKETVLRAAVAQRVESLLSDVARERPSFSAALKAYYDAHLRQDHAAKRDIAGWLMGDPHASARSIPGLRGQVERTDVLAYLREFVRMMRHLERPGLVIVLDELDEMRHLRRDMRQRAWANLRDLVDQLGRGVPGLFLVLAGTPDVLEGHRGLTELPPLAQRLEDLTLHTAHPNLRGPQLSLPAFDEAQLVRVMVRIEQVWEVATGATSRLAPGFPAHLAQGWTERLGPRSPRMAIREFIGVLDRLHDYPDYNPAGEYNFQVSADAFLPAELGAEADPADVF